MNENVLRLKLTTTRNNLAVIAESMRGSAGEALLTHEVKVLGDIIDELTDENTSETLKRRSQAARKKMHAKTKR